MTAHILAAEQGAGNVHDCLRGDREGAQRGTGVGPGEQQTSGFTKRDFRGDINRIRNGENNRKTLASLTMPWRNFLSLLT